MNIYSAHCRVYSPVQTLESTDTVHTVYYTVLTVYYIVHTVYYKVHTDYYTVHTSYYTLHTNGRVQSLYLSSPEG